MAFSLNLDPQFEPFPNLESLPFDHFEFAGGEPHIKLKDSLWAEEVTVTLRPHSWQDLGLLALTVDALRRAGSGPVSALLPYLPGARQDRVMVPGEPLSVKVYTAFLNSLALKRVTIFDPHSAVGPALLDNVESITNLGFARVVLAGLPQNTILVAPDAGAQKKVYHVAAALGGLEVIEAGKRRDVKTGALSGFSVYGDAKQLSDRSCLILDDICDGGGTFLGLAAELRKYGVRELYLAVSHGIFSQGVDRLTDAFEGVFCTDSFSSLPPQSGLTQVLLRELLSDALS